MRLQDGTVVRLDRHLARMAGSARHFGFPWNDAGVRSTVASAADSRPHGTWRMRLLVTETGLPSAECTPYEPGEPRVWRVGFALAPVDERDEFLRNKTTRRNVYDAARRARPGLDDVLLWNGRQEVTETTIANVVVERSGVRYTPPVACGLLPGVFRAELIDAGAIRERVLTKDDVARAPRLWLINSLREWVEAVLV